MTWVEESIWAFCRALAFAGQLIGLIGLLAFAGAWLKAYLTRAAKGD